MNTYGQMIETLCVECIPGWQPLVQLRLEGRYAPLALNAEPMAIMAKQPLSFNVQIRMEVHNGTANSDD